MLERIRGGLSGLQLPRTLLIRTEGCDGDIDASYDAEEATVSFCYEYLAYIQELSRNIPPAAAAHGLTPENYVAGAFLDVVLHEVAHAIFDLNKVPILGREEDAADQLAACLVLRLGEQEARRAVASIAAMYASEAKEAPPKLRDFADEHGVPAQRFFNLLCIGCGKDPRAFGDMVKSFLPAERAEHCEDEYRQVEFAIARLIAPAWKKVGNAKHRRRAAS